MSIPIKNNLFQIHLQNQSTLTNQSALVLYFVTLSLPHCKNFGDIFNMSDFLCKTEKNEMANCKCKLNTPR